MDGSSGGGEKVAPPQRKTRRQRTSRYESQKRRDWNTFTQFLKEQSPPIALSRCSGANVVEFLEYMDQFGKTRVHAQGCEFHGQPKPRGSCSCPLRQAWGSLDALVGRLRAKYEENGGAEGRELNPFAASTVRVYLRGVKESQGKARGIRYRKKRKGKADELGEASGTAKSPPEK